MSPENYLHVYNQSMFATVSIINVPIALDLEYSIPEILAQEITIGDVVYLNLANQKALGVVVDTYSKQRTNLTTQSIIQKITEIPPLDPNRIRIANDLSRILLQPRGRFLRKMLPVKFAIDIARVYTLRDEGDISAVSRDLSDLLEKLNKSGTLVSNRLSKKTNEDLRSLSKKRIVDSSLTLVRKNIKNSRVKVYEALPAAEFLANKLVFGKTELVAERRREAFDHILREGPVRDSWIIASTGCRPEDLKWLVEHELIQLTDQPENLVELPSSDRPLRITNHAFSETRSTEFNENKIYVYQQDRSTDIFQFYFQLITQERARGKFSWLIFPEIFEVEKAAELFSNQFGFIPTVFHGRLSENRRVEIWNDVNEGQIDILFGTVDALFLPVQDPGMIILDEYMNCSSLEMSGFVYNAKTIADQLHLQFNTKNIYASVLPDIEDIFTADYGVSTPAGAKYKRITAPLSNVIENFNIVDMAAELKNGNISVISEELAGAIQKSLERKKLTVLFLNRKGYASYVFCRDCGYTRKCDRCGSVIRVRKAGSQNEVCEQCGTQNQITNQCPVCDSSNYRPYGAGIEKVEEACRSRFPDARIARWESGLSGEGVNEIIYSRVINGEIDIIIGTQAISKNVYLPPVGTLGFVLGESSFNSPDPYQVERNYRLFVDLIQKTDLETDLILQTYQPQEKMWLYLRDCDHKSFIADQLDRRYELGYPPFKRLIKLTNTSNSIEKCEFNCDRIRKKVIELLNTEGINEGEIYYAPADENIISKNYIARLVLKNIPDAIVARLDLGPDWQVDVSPRSII